VDGLEVCRRLRSAGEDLPVLVLTARDAVPDRVTGLDAGADDYLPKPFLLEELLARLRALLRRSTSDTPTDTDAALSFADNDSPAHEADSCSSLIEAPAGGIKEVTLSHPIKRHDGFKIRLTTTIIGVASVIVAIIGLIPPFASTFWMPDASSSKIGHSNTASCVKIGNMNISLANGIPEVVAGIRVGMEVHATGQGYTYWLFLMLVLTDGSVRTEERQVENVPSVVTFPFDFPPNVKHYNLIVDVDLAGATNVPGGACS
jgi:hypothetical protein